MCEFIAGGLAGCALTLIVLAPILRREWDTYEQEIRNGYTQSGSPDSGAADRGDHRHHRRWIG